MRWLWFQLINFCVLHNIALEFFNFVKLHLISNSNRPFLIKMSWKLFGYLLCTHSHITKVTLEVRGSGSTVGVVG